MEEYILYVKPDFLYLNLHEIEGFSENSYPYSASPGNYFVELEWYKSVIKDRKDIELKHDPLTYIPIQWPFIQDLMELPGFREHSFLINDEKGFDDFGSSAYFVNKKWYEEMTKCKCSGNCTSNGQCSCCGDNRFEIIEAAKKDLLKATNIDSDPDEMKVIDSILFRCWQMGWLDKYDNKTNN